MKKNIAFLTAVIILGTAASACGIQKAGTQTASAEKTAAVTESETTEETETQENEIKEEEPAPLRYSKALDTESDSNVPSAAVRGDEKTYEYRVIQAADVKNSPDSDGAFLGTVESGAVVYGFQRTEGSWVMVVYNGHIAYIPSYAVGTDAEENVQTSAVQIQAPAVTAHAQETTAESASSEEEESGTAASESEEKKADGTEQTSSEPEQTAPEETSPTESTDTSESAPSETATEPAETTEAETSPAVSDES